MSEEFSEPTVIKDNRRIDPETGEVRGEAPAAEPTVGGPNDGAENADLEAALPVLVRAIVQNGGQTCSAGSRASPPSPPGSSARSALACPADRRATLPIARRWSSRRFPAPGRGSPCR